LDFLGGGFLMLLGIITYVMTGDLFWALHRQ
jgi:hypothetical protein